MQLLLIIGIIFAITAVIFALQNNAAVSVVFGPWHLDSSLAVVLLLALGVGVAISGLVSEPARIKAGWMHSRGKRRITELESENAALAQRVATLEAEVARLNPEAPPPPAPEEPKPYVGLTTLLGAEKPDAP